MTASQEVLAVAVRMKTLGGKPTARVKRLASVRFVRSVCDKRKALGTGQHERSNVLSV